MSAPQVGWLVCVGLRGAGCGLLVDAGTAASLVELWAPVSMCNAPFVAHRNRGYAPPGHRRRCVAAVRREAGDVLVRGSDG